MEVKRLVNIRTRRWEHLEASLVTCLVSHLKMPPSLIPVAVLGAESRHNLLELASCHLWQVVKVDDGPAPRLFATDDVTARRLVIFFPVEAASKVHKRILTKR